MEPFRGPYEEAEDIDPWFGPYFNTGELRLVGNCCKERRVYRSLPPGALLTEDRSSRADSLCGEEARLFIPAFS